MGAWLVAIAGGLIAAFRALREARQARELRREELRWRKAELAREILSEFRQNPRVQSAETILDWTGRSFEVAPGKSETISWEEMRRALCTTDVMNFSTMEAFVRDCFDSLFGALEHYLRTGLVQFEDVEFPLEYTVTKLRLLDEAAKSLVTTYGYDLVPSFIGRF
ncbi:MAG TPA: hypothetical protein VLG48_12085 [Candidatus Methylomirabilis sp.]|nr:hypothetical protein [Candidatus Methylomirabilis sp.]